MKTTTAHHRWIYFWFVAFLLSNGLALLADEPLAIRGYSDKARKAFTMVWEPVRSTNGFTYNVYRRTTLRGTPAKINSYPLTIPVYADRIDGQTFYYTVRSVSSQGLESGDSLTIDSTPETHVFFLATDGKTVLTIPASAAAPLQPSK